MLTPTILFSKPADPTGEYQSELEVAQKHLLVIGSRMKVLPGQLVIGRYSVLPFYKELEEDIKYVGGKLINTYRQHRYIADLQNWYADLARFTPETWNNIASVPDDCGRVVLKGETNSRKERWKTHMFANNKQEAIDVFMRLNDDGFIQGQNIYIRKFVDLVTLTKSPITDQPITLEYRFFCCDGKILTSGFYWSNFMEDVKEQLTVSTPVEATELVEKVLLEIDDKARFVVVDVAQTKSGQWVLIELNDGQMSGLSENNPDELYKALSDTLRGSES